MTGRYTREDIMKMVEEENVRYIRLQFTDLLGTIKNVEIPRSQLEKALDVINTETSFINTNDK